MKQLIYKHSTKPLQIIRGFEQSENECVACLLTDIPTEGGFASKEIFERLIRAAFQGGLKAARRNAGIGT